MGLTVHNVRLGLATNSSSTHSIVILRPGTRLRDDGAGDHQFGWDAWTAASRAAKRDWLGYHLFDSLVEHVAWDDPRRDAAEETARTLVEELLGCRPDPDGSVDHQSMISLPRAWDGAGVDRAFVEDFARFLDRDDVAVFGGNDNDDAAHPHADKVAHDAHYRSRFDVDTSAADVVARQDPAGFWTLFNRASGAKTRFSFDGGDTTVAARSMAPELVDLKATNQCHSGCRYCYQDSTPEGVHASLDRLERVAEVLGNLRVFEVAIGGGEPLEHPDFVAILRAFRSRGVVPNFTTRELGWLEDPARRAEVLGLCGGFALSVDGAAAVERMGSLAGDDHDEWSRPHRFNVQYVLGTGTRATFEAVARACAEHRFRLTLLAYKHVGRGLPQYERDASWWLEALAELRKDEVYLNVGIDTPLAAREAERLEAAGVDQRLFEVVEGAHSMYLDATTWTVGPSSYAPEAQHALSPGAGEAELLGRFQAFAAEAAA